MKRIIVPIVVLLAFNCVQSQGVTQDEKQIIKNLVQNAFDDIWSNYDTSKLSVHHTKDFLLLENGHVWTNDTIANYQEKGRKRPARKRINSFDFIKYEKYGKSIWAAYHNYASITNTDGNTQKAQWLESVVAIETTSGWKLKMMHSTWVPLQRKE